jgi:hypothetical protein
MMADEKTVVIELNLWWIARALRGMLEPHPHESKGASSDIRGNYPAKELCKRAADALSAMDPKWEGDQSMLIAQLRKAAE